MKMQSLKWLRVPLLLSRDLVRRIDTHTVEVVLKSSTSMLVLIAGLSVGMLVSIFLGRTLGPPQA